MCLQNLITKRALLLLTALLLLPVSIGHTASDADSVTEKLLAKSNQVAMILTNQKNEGTLSAASALEIIREQMSPLIDFRRLTKRAMGKHWKKAAANMQDDITDSFRQLLEASYAKILAKYSGQKISHVGTVTRPNGNIVVKIAVTGAKKGAEISYVFFSDDANEYKIGDIKVEKISLVRNYRLQFNGAIKKHGIEGLAKFLAEKAAKK